MKPKAFGWLIFVVKSVVAALLFMLAGVGLVFILQGPPTTGGHTWWAWIEYFSQHHPIGVSLILISLLATWLVSMLHFYEQMMLNQLIRAVDELTEEVTDMRSMARLPLHHWGERLGPLAQSVESLYETAHTMMIEERNIERSKDEMITNVSHDLRTPLTSILGYLGLIINDEQGQLKPADMRKYSKTAYNKALQMKSLVEDLFDYTQVKQVDFKLRWAPIDLAALLQQLAASYELEAKNHGIVVSVVAQPEMIEMVGDPDRLARVFMNLISNALKYGEEATFIRLSARKLPDENEVEVRVTNNGRPIPASSVDHLFDRFYRVEHSRNTKTGGTGLGLAIVESVVSAHNGTVTVESTDELTSFIVRLPLEPVGDDVLPNEE